MSVIGMDVCVVVVKRGVRSERALCIVAKIIA